MLRAAQQSTSVTLQSLIDTRHKVIQKRRANNIGRSDFPGQRTGPRRGQGLEFIDLRQYQSSDDVRHIDWNVTARSNEPHTRLYREEREHNTTVVIDLRPDMFTGSDCLRAVSASRLAASVLWQASMAGDRCGALVITAHGLQHTRPLAGNNGVLQALECIASNFERASQIKSQQAPPLSEVLDNINSRRRQSGSYFVFSGFDIEDDNHWDESLPVTGVTGRMIAVLLLDSMEVQGLPHGVYHYQLNNRHSSSDVATIHSSNRQQLNSRLQDNISRRQKQFETAAIPLLTVPSSRSDASVLTELVTRELL